MVWTIQRKIGALTAGILLLFVVAIGSQMVLTRRLEGRLTRDIEQTQHDADLSADLAFKARDAQLAVVQVQQYLTDISATRGTDGYDDGFARAESNAKNFGALLTEFQKIYQQRDDETALAQLKTLEANFEGYYAMGQKMAHAYVSGGHEAGNPLMAQFDPLAEKLSASVALLVQRHHDEMSAALQQLAERSKQVRTAFASLERWGWTLLLVALLAGIGEVFLVGRIAQPLVNLSAIARAMAGGDLSQHQLPWASRRDEVGELAKSFAEMLRRNREVVTALQQSTASLAESSVRMSTTSQEYASTAAEQSSAVNQIGATVQELNDISHSTADTAKAVLQHSAEVASEGEAGRVTIGRAVVELEGTAKVVDRIAVRVQELSGAAEQIGDIVKMVRGISEQSNLLAVNAGIEAAKAGEQGRGFGVVATEVRRLAAQSKEAVGNIGTLLNKIHSATKSAVSETEAGRRAAEAGSKALGDIRTVVETLVDAMNDSAEQVRTIAASTNQQAAGVGEIRGAMQDVARSAKATSEGVQQLEQVAIDVREAAREIEKVSAFYRL